MTEKVDSLIRELDTEAEIWLKIAKDARTENPKVSVWAWGWYDQLKNTADGIRTLRDGIGTEPEIEGDARSTWWYACGECHTAIDTADRFCRQCGRPVKWT